MRPASCDTCGKCLPRVPGWVGRDDETKPNHHLSHEINHDFHNLSPDRPPHTHALQLLFCTVHQRPHPLSAVLLPSLTPLLCQHAYLTHTCLLCVQVTAANAGSAAVGHPAAAVVPAGAAAAPHAAGVATAAAALHAVAGAAGAVATAGAAAATAVMTVTTAVAAAARAMMTGGGGASASGTGAPGTRTGGGRGSATAARGTTTVGRSGTAARVGTGSRRPGRCCWW